MSSEHDGGGMTIYVGQAGEKYSDPEDWRDLIAEGRLTPGSVVPVRRGGELLHLRAADIPELATLFAEAEGGSGTEPSAPDLRDTSETTAPIRHLPSRTQAAAPADVVTVTLGKTAEQPTAAPLPPHAAGRAPLRPATAQDRPRASGPSMFRQCLTRDFARLSGRAGRKEFWSFALGQLLLGVSLPVMVAVGGANGSGGLNGFGTAVLVGWALFLLYCIIPSIAVSVRRLHDLGASGWVLVLVLVPYLGPLLLLLAAALPSQPGGDRYGPSPA